jgi:hypothetical protein
LYQGCSIPDLIAIAVDFDANFAVIEADDSPVARSMAVRPREKRSFESAARVFQQVPERRQIRKDRIRNGQ